MPENAWGSSLGFWKKIVAIDEMNNFQTVLDYILILALIPGDISHRTSYGSYPSHQSIPPVMNMAGNGDADLGVGKENGFGVAGAGKRHSDD